MLNMTPTKKQYKHSHWKEIIDYLKQYIKTHDQRRFVWFSFGIGIIGTGISIYQMFQVKDVQQQLADIKYDFPKAYNEQKTNTSKWDWWKVLSNYFERVNKWEYEKACSLLSTFQCSMYDVSLFTDRVNNKKRVNTIKYQDGEKLISVWNGNVTYENINWELRCGKIEFTINYEKDPIYQIRQYTIITRPDGWKEIRRSICESAYKNWENRSIQMNCNAQEKICWDK